MKKLYEFVVKNKVKQDNNEYVDLDLPSGTLWAKCNIGAKSEEQCGDYYAWGETESKTSYEWSTYKFGIDPNSFNKYNFKDKLEVLESKDDIVNKLMGTDWHIPTIKQCEELFKNTRVEIAENKGVKGMLFISKRDVNKYIFLPFSGYIRRQHKGDIGTTGEIWTNELSPISKGLYMASTLYFDDGLNAGEIYQENRSTGHNIRGVKN